MLTPHTICLVPIREKKKRRLKVPDGVNGTELVLEPEESDSSDSSSEEEDKAEEEGKSGGSE